MAVLGLVGGLFPDRKTKNTNSGLYENANLNNNYYFWFVFNLLNNILFLFFTIWEIVDLVLLVGVQPFKITISHLMNELTLTRFHLKLTFANLMWIPNCARLWSQIVS